jgi:hypothetical protein
LPAERFEVVVRGRMSPTLVAAMGDFDVTPCTDGHTHLVGEVVDTQQLHRLFQVFLDLNIELISVNPVP